MTRIRCEVRDESPVTVVRLAGALDLGTMRAVHEVLDRCLAAQPDALVVDLEEIEVGEPLRCPSSPPPRGAQPTGRRCRWCSPRPAPRRRPG
ncbi:ATP-binding protein, partial [Micromonospora chalcea]|uniref:STAS domain-containing protein n=1 Tax=Micromonospora chalcea TaxID=1874 RepID=UPI003485FF9F